MPDDPRVVDSTGALELPSIPKRMLVVGGGIIGLEMATVYSTLGARLDVVEMLDGLMQGADRDLVKVWEKMNAPRFDNVMLKTKTVGGRSDADGHRGQVRRREGAGRAAALRPGAVGGRPQPERQDDRRRQGRRRRHRPRLHRRSTSRCAPTCRTSSRSATSSASRCSRTRRCTKAHVAAEAAAGEKSYFDARVDSVGRLHRSRDRLGRRHRGRVRRRRASRYGKAAVPVGRVGPRDRQRPRRRLHQAAVRRGDAPHHRRRHRRHARRRPDRRDRAGDRDGRDAVDIGKTIHPHPTLGESIGMAAEVFEGVCTDLPPVKKK